MSRANPSERDLLVLEERAARAAVMRDPSLRMRALGAGVSGTAASPPRPGTIPRGTTFTATGSEALVLVRCGQAELLDERPPWWPADALTTSRVPDIAGLAAAYEASLRA